MLILGVDPGTQITGFGVLESDGSAHRCLDCGAVKLPSRLPMPERLALLHSRLSELLSRHAFDALALEDLFYASNVKTAMRLSQARGVIMLAAAQHKVPVFEYPPLEVKNAVVGYGRADKNQVQEMVRHILRLAARPEPADAADALAVAICHAQTHSMQRKIRAAERRSSRS